MCAFKYQRRPHPDRYVTSVLFSISLYGKVVSELTFDTEQTEEYAIKQVEAYLSRPITQSHFDAVKHDLFDPSLTFADLEKHDYCCRGDLLTDCVFLDRIERITENKILLWCGS